MHSRFAFAADLRSSRVPKGAQSLSRAHTVGRLTQPRLRPSRMTQSTSATFRNWTRRSGARLALWSPTEPSRSPCESNGRCLSTSELQGKATRRESTACLRATSAHSAGQVDKRCAGARTRLCKRIPTFQSRAGRPRSGILLVTQVKLSHYLICSLASQRPVRKIVQVAIR